MADRGRGRWIALEGLDGCGKSTQATRLAAALDARLTREPGGTAVGTQIRRVLLDPANHGLCARTEALLYAADRAQHVVEVVEPTLAAGRDVVSDRSVVSSLAYQGVGRGLGLDAVRRVNAFALDGCWPDLAVVLRLPAGVARERMAAGGDLDRIERADPAFFAAVADGFDALAAAEPDRVVVLDAAGTPDTVAAAVRDLVRERLGR